MYHITQADYDESFSRLCDKGSAPVQLVSCGCPHYTLQEIRDCANYIKGKKVKDSVTLIFWTNSSLREAARLSGYLDTIEAAGATIGTNGCPLVQGPNCYEGVTGMAVDAAKQAHYNRSYLKNGHMFYGTMALTSLTLPANFNTSSVADMSPTRRSSRSCDTAAGSFAGRGLCLQAKPPDGGIRSVSTVQQI